VDTVDGVSDATELGAGVVVILESSIEDGNVNVAGRLVVEDRSSIGAVVVVRFVQ
jgi:hypothetical protein